MASFPYTVVDVFSDRPLAGNALAVVHDADGLDDATMLAFAREARLSETAFVQSAGGAGADYRNRIFTVMEEVPFAGHPSLGAAVAVAARRGERAASYVQETGAGRQAIDVRLEPGGRRGHAGMLQPTAAFDGELEPAAVLPAVGLAAGDAHPHLPAQVVSTGLATLIAPVAARAAVSRAAPDLAALRACLAAASAYTLYLVWPDPAGGRAHARSFTPQVSAGEDPATGSAAGPLGAYLAERLGWLRVVIDQGAEMGRPSRLVAEAAAGGVRVAGDATVIVQGVLTL